MNVIPAEEGGVIEMSRSTVKSRNTLAGKVPFGLSCAKPVFPTKSLLTLTLYSADTEDGASWHVTLWDFISFCVSTPVTDNSSSGLTV